jgi:hypothetical protein
VVITELKPLDEILNLISPYSTVLIAGCDGCTQPPRSIKEAEILSRLLELGGRHRGKKFHFRVTTIAKQCDSHLVATMLGENLQGIETVLSLGCGAGVQTIVGMFPDLTVLPAQNTLFIGTEDRKEGLLEERCAACGDCLLGLTGGICPVARCAKSLLNGPCGGCSNGKCEVDAEKDCAWYLIIKRLEKLGRLDIVEETRPPRNFQVVIRPGRIAERPLEEAKQ